MTKQEQIEEMINTLAASNNPFVDVPVEIMPQIAKALYNAGYRKAEKVRKETAKEFAEKLKVNAICLSAIEKYHVCNLIDELLKEYEE